MNERIQKLAEQSGVTVITTHGMEGVVDGCYIVGPAHLQKFAELIIKDCIGLCNQWPDTVRQVMARQIKEHFGVEE